MTDDVVEGLASGSTAKVRGAAQRLVEAICGSLARLARRRSASAPAVKVLRTRPRLADSEFHGLYSRFENGDSEIKVWMLTAAHGQIVRPRTFLRTLLHEVCHHVDMTLLDLPHSLHTLGFHARESSLLRVLEKSGGHVPGGRQSPPPRSSVGPQAVAPGGAQLELFNRPTARSSSGRRRGRGD